MVVTALFAVLAGSLLGALPLWLDEILQLLETLDTSTTQLLRAVPRNSGAAPLGYLAQQASLRITGYGLKRARIPALIFGIAAVFAVAVLASELGVKPAWLAALIFAAFPATLRYADEARLYSQAVFLSILATILFLRLAKQPSPARAICFSTALLLAIYTQPFTIFIGFAAVVWSILCRDFRTARMSGIALAAAAVAFVPWFLWSRSEWAAGIARAGFHFTFSIHTPLMLFREIPGAGYWASGLLLILCAVAASSPSIPRRTKWLIALLIFTPVAGGLAADAQAGYFIASRQFLWILPAVAILSAAALTASRLTIPVFAALLIVCGLQGAKYFRAPHENWQAAANDAARFAQAHAACLATNPPDYLRILGFFRPELLNCAGPVTPFPVEPFATER